jgi:predicted metal-dependent hydrolase
MRTRIQLGDIRVEVVRKDIKNVHLSVHPPTGRVRIAAPERMNLDTVRVFAIAKLPWIKRQQRKLREQERETAREYIDRESHYVWGKRYLLKVVEADRRPGVELDHGRIVLHVRPGTRRGKREAVVEEWHRELVREAVPPTIEKWERLIGVRVRRFFIQRMKTKWGSCNDRAGYKQPVVLLPQSGERSIKMEIFANTSIAMATGLSPTRRESYTNLAPPL